MHQALLISFSLYLLHRVSGAVDQRSLEELILSQKGILSFIYFSLWKKKVFSIFFRLSDI